MLDMYPDGIAQTTGTANLKKERYHADHFIRPKVGNKYIDTVTDDDCQEIINSALRAFTLTRLAKDTLNSQRLLQLDPVQVFPIFSLSTFLS